MTVVQFWFPNLQPRYGGHLIRGLCHGKKGELFHHYERGLEN